MPLFTEEIEERLAEFGAGHRKVLSADAEHQRLRKRREKGNPQISQITQIRKETEGHARAS